MFAWLKAFLPGQRDRNTGSYELSDEDRDAVGSIVETLSLVRCDDHSGRVRFRGSTWPATAVAEDIPPGQRARIVYRDNLAWVIEAYAGLAQLGEKDLL
ncbi:MAG: NfeD family protein [Candidatus Sericytochromatia bacterium]|nr:NfeD family protein [Candidatus Sericytochromatia bacterium]